MVTIVYPDWYSEAEEMLEDVINKIAVKNNLKYTFVEDSKSIEHGKDIILKSLVRISWDAPGEFTEEQLKDIKEIKKSLRKNNRRSK